MHGTGVGRDFAVRTLNISSIISNIFCHCLHWFSSPDSRLYFEYIRWNSSINQTDFGKKCFAIGGVWPAGWKQRRAWLGGSTLICTLKGTRQGRAYPKGWMGKRAVQLDKVESLIAIHFLSSPQQYHFAPLPKIDKFTIKHWSSRASATVLENCLLWKRLHF